MHCIQSQFGMFIQRSGNLLVAFVVNTVRSDSDKISNGFELVAQQVQNETGYIRFTTITRTSG